MNEISDDREIDYALAARGRVRYAIWTYHIHIYTYTFIYNIICMQL